MSIALRDPEFWRRYLPWTPDSLAPFREFSFQMYELGKNGSNKRVKSMLSGVELALLYALTKEHWSGEGEIVDLGCFYGAPTWCLAQGMRDNGTVLESSMTKRLYAYDLFLAESYDWYLQNSETVHAGSIFNEFLSLNSDRLDLIVPCPGDLLQMRWGSKPIEILHIDAAKSWDLNKWIVSKMFPALIPGKSIVLQQDYVHFNEYWVAITMEFFSDRFEHLHTIFGGTAAFICTKGITAEEASKDLSKLHLDEKKEIFLRALSKAPISAQEVMKVGLAKMMLDNGEFDEAEAILETVRLDVTDQPELNFSGIAKSNKSIVSGFLVEARRHSV